MSDVIQLLPDSVANQIAAGEVIQRPASAVKELLENAVDAKATEISLIVKDAGKTLIKVVDNGIGMSETDARLCFERHATSKLRSADDLFSIKSFGFRGEALASIASIAHVELKTKTPENDTGICIVNEGSEVKEQEPCSIAGGTSISVKNLFYNVPARRNFLKSDPVEFKHIMEEFTRVALPNINTSFTLIHNDQDVYNLKPGTLKQRIVSLFGNNYNERLVPAEENTDIVKVKGFVGKPEFARKTRGEQYFFINARFIKSAYLNHAIQTAYKEIISENSYPSYFLFLEIDPKLIDVNIHPTKTEIKFQDERTIYMILRSTVKRALGKHHLSPSLDFEQETSIDVNISPNREIKAPSVKVDPNFNPFKSGGVSTKERSKDNWESLYSGFENLEKPIVERQDEQLSFEGSKGSVTDLQVGCIQLLSKYIVFQLEDKLAIVDQQLAHERVLYEKYIKVLANNQRESQQLLFPTTLQVGKQNYELLKELDTDLFNLGFNISHFSNDTINISGIPADANDTNIEVLIESFLQDYKENIPGVELKGKKKLAYSLAKNTAIKRGRKLDSSEMKNLVNELLHCENSNTDIKGKLILTKFSEEELLNKLKRKAE